MAIKVSLDELVDLCLAHGVEILELVHGREFNDVETIGQDAIWLSLEEMLAFVGGNVRDCGEDVCAVSSASFDAVAMVDAPLSCFMVDVKVLQIVVKVDGAGAVMLFSLVTGTVSQTAPFTHHRYRPSKVACVVKMVVTSILRFRHSGIARPACHS